jgi:hypothetical protein
VRVGRIVRVILAVLAHPTLWGVALRTWWRTTPRRWWARAPFLPVPSGEYLRFRLLTQYGRKDADISPDDVVNYLAWCRRQARAV